MKSKFNIAITSAVLCTILVSCSSVSKTGTEQYRPHIHFTPPSKWMNDPNGMVFFNNTYHLFYQHYPDSTVWGPMHWGHATSTDLINWQHQPIALYPDSLGYIFSGSAVVDSNNTSGFGKNGQIPLVAIFTHHDPTGEQQHRDDFQNQSIAYSVDNGKSWTKFSGNPVLKNPGIRDFRDPKVAWHNKTQKWIMTLATLDRITFYSSPDLKTWTKESEFGKEVGAHGGVWECPDLFSFDVNGEKIWVLLVSINPGGPNGGSATQYFTGTFDGKTFTPFQTDTRWIDYGPDDYAGVIWSNTGRRKIFLGWMNNWQYANLVPTEKWRGAATIPRDLSLQKIGDKYFIASTPSHEINNIITDTQSFTNIDANNYELKALTAPCRIDLHTPQLETFSFTLSNSKGQKIVAGYDKSVNEFYIDRTNSGKTNFEKGFAARHKAPRISAKPSSDVSFIIDVASIELFADSGLSVMTSTFFPGEPFSEGVLDGGGKFNIVLSHLH